MAYIIGAVFIASSLPDIWYMSAIAQARTVGRPYEEVLRERAMQGTSNANRDREIDRLNFIAETNEEKIAVLNAQVERLHARLQAADERYNDLRLTNRDLQNQVQTIQDIGRWVLGASLGQLFHMLIGLSMWFNSRRARKGSGL